MRPPRRPARAPTARTAGTDRRRSRVSCGPRHRRWETSRARRHPHRARRARRRQGRRAPSPGW